MEYMFSSGGFTVLSYNILADMYVSMNKKRYEYCPTEALMWSYRSHNLLREILNYEADIICLQEVQADHMEDFFGPELTKYGYSYLYKRKTQEMFIGGKYVMDGCAFFFRHRLFKVIQHYEIEFNKSLQSRVEILNSELKFQASKRLLKHNVALVVVLEMYENKKRICVVNTHIHANSVHPDVKMLQVENLVSELEKIVQSDMPIIMCGDFNSLPSSDVYKFITNKVIHPNTKNTDPLGIFKNRTLSHSLHLASAYKSFNTSEPMFTTKTPKSSNTLDYIFFTENNLSVETTIQPLSHEKVSMGLPCTKWSSDHTAMLARFLFKPSQFEIQERILLPQLNCNCGRCLIPLHDLSQMQLPVFQLQQLSFNPHIMVPNVFVTRSNSQKVKVQELIFPPQVHAIDQHIKFTTQMQIPQKIIRSRDFPISFIYNDLGEKQFIPIH